MLPRAEAYIPHEESPTDEEPILAPEATGSEGTSDEGPLVHGGS